MLNYLGFIPVFFVFIGVFISILIILLKKSKIDNCLTKEEYKIFIENSYKINDNKIFKEKNIYQIVENGIYLLKNDKFNLLEGVKM